MNVRRFVLRLAVGLLCFAVGWASAAMLGATRGAHDFEPRTHIRTELIIVPHVEPPVSPLAAHPHFEPPPLGPTGCTLRFPDNGEVHIGGPEFDHFRFAASSPPPPKKSRRAGR